MPTNPVVDLVGRGGETDSWLSRCRHGGPPSSCRAAHTSQ